MILEWLKKLMMKKLKIISIAVSVGPVNRIKIKEAPEELILRGFFTSV